MERGNAPMFIHCKKEDQSKQHLLKGQWQTAKL